LQYSADERAYLALRQKPEWLARPVPENTFFWQAFNHLRGSRGASGAIPFSEISAYCDWAGVSCPVQRTRLANVVIALDNAERTNGPRPKN
jgi:hypothetical protein